MQQLSVRNNQSKLKISGDSPILLKVFEEYIPQINKERPERCKHILESQGSRLIMSHPDTGSHLLLCIDKPLLSPRNTAIVPEIVH